MESVVPGVVMTAPGESTTRNVRRRRSERLWLQLALCICMLYIYICIHYIILYVSIYIYICYIGCKISFFFASRVYAGSFLIFFVCVHAIVPWMCFLAEGPKMSLGHPYRNYGIAVLELFLI